MLNEIRKHGGLEYARVLDRFHQHRSQAFWAEQLEITAGRENRQASQ